MNKKVLKSSIAGIIVGFGMMAAPCFISAVETTAATDECAKELLLSYFPEPIVTETLKKFKVSEDKWAGINKSLSNKDKEVVKIVEQKASAMNPNPLKDPQQRQVAVKLFRDTLLQVFSDALKENGIQDTSQYQTMLDDIQQQKAKKFAMCMEKQKAQLQQNQSGPSNDEDEDDSDEDDSDEDSDSKDDTHSGAVKDSKNSKTETPKETK